ncbi:hypothetical protein [Salinicoccus sp. YB14-2]|uniref:hypothetical protein n=1 Tax=Salinicoccus sp. YB14-2 TaxID=1572701 RepID=UPI00068C9EB9|nr:hypothetical protein [Salinicoccus sp. YB14-2]
MNNEQYTPKILTVWITPDPSAAINVDFEKLTSMVELTKALDLGVEKTQTVTLNFYYDREEQLDTINFKNERALMKNTQVDAVFFIIPDIRILMANHREFRAFIKSMADFQLKNSYVITYHNRFSMHQISRFFNNCADVLRHSVEDLIGLRNGNDTDQLTISFYLHHVLNVADTLLEDMTANEDDFEYYGEIDIRNYLYIHKLISLREGLFKAIELRRVKIED